MLDALPQGGGLGQGAADHPRRPGDANVIVLIPHGSAGRFVSRLAPMRAIASRSAA
jgi:hypothetical protein